MGKIFIPAKGRRSLLINSPPVLWASLSLFEPFLVWLYLFKGEVPRIDSVHQVRSDQCSNHSFSWKLILLLQATIVLAVSFLLRGLFFCTSRAKRLWFCFTEVGRKHFLAFCVPSRISLEGILFLHLTQNVSCFLTHKSLARQKKEIFDELERMFSGKKIP